MLTQYENDMIEIRRSLSKLHEKIDAITNGPIFKRTLSITDTLDEKVAKNLNSLNQMILEVKGMAAQFRSLRGRRSDWDGEEVKYPQGKECLILAGSTPLEIQ